jgi:hypothetical protein
MLSLDFSAPMAYINPMVIFETPIFTRQVQELFTDEEYRKLQNELVARPEAEDLIPGSGGLRKIRWKAHGRGKRGGTALFIIGLFTNRLF